MVQQHDIGSFRRLQERFGGMSTMFVAKYFGERFPFFYVMEYMKSGGTWLRNMLADYTGIPAPEHFVLPIGFRAILHRHWAYNKRYRRVWYLYRDGRDVCVSLYFHNMRILTGDREAGDVMPYRQRRYESLFGKGFDPQDCARHLPRFIEYEATHASWRLPFWHEHVRQWICGRPGVVTLRYEDLLSDCVGTLARIIPAHADIDINMEKLNTTVSRFSFERQTGRKRGEENKNSFLRRGIAGDWKNYFTREAAEVFDHYCGETLIRLGYESDRTWVHTCSDSSPIGV